ncbi:MAG TPA: S9 family peptidase [Gemmataceae bacterium]|nr:S9 family peptidase [Gemmataceae bacterium]
MSHTSIRFVAALVLFALAPLAVADSPPKRPMTFEDLWAVRRVGAPSMAPDGKWCVVDVTTYDVEKDDSTSELWLLATDGKSQRQLTSSGGKNTGPVWSPNGQSIAFVSERGNDESAQVYVITPTGGEARRLTHMPMAPAALKWAADSSKVFCIGWTWPDTPTDDAYKKKEKGLKDAKSKAFVIDDAAFRYWDKWIADGKRPNVFAVDAKTGDHKNLLAGAGKHLPPYEPTAHDYDISPDGKELCFVAENVKEIGLDNNHDLYTLALDREGSKPVDITAENAAQDTNPVYSPDGRHIAFTRQTTKFFYADRTQVMLHERAGGTRSLTADFDYSCTNPKWMTDSKRLFFDVEQRGFHRIGFANIEKPGVNASGPNASERTMDVAKHDRVSAYIVTSFDRPPQVYSHRPAAGSTIPIDHFNDELVARWKVGKVDNRTFKGADDKDVQMWVFYPPDFDAAKKWPVVQLVHGGPHNAITSDFSFRWNPQLWAAQGWVVAVVNFHGSSGFGQAFTDSITGDLGTKPMTDIMKATDWFEQQRWIDKNRMAAAGGSYGGYMMAWLNGHTDRFKALVCHAGVYNWHSMLASDLVKGRERSLGAPPWGNLDKIDRQSAQRFAADFKTPTLVLHGEKDFRVPVTQGLEFYNTLRQKGVPTRLVYFPDENHRVLKPQNSRLWHKEVFAWLTKYIGRGAG